LDAEDASWHLSLELKTNKILSSLIFHHFPIKALPKIAKCHRSSALDLTSRTLPRFRLEKISTGCERKCLLLARNGILGSEVRYWYVERNN
jgi:hypothetical protein